MVINSQQFVMHTMEINIILYHVTELVGPSVTPYIIKSYTIIFSLELEEKGLGFTYYLKLC